MESFVFVMFTARLVTKHQLKEQLDLNAATRSLILTVLATFYIPLAFVSSYFGMNASGFTEGGLVSTTTFWQVSVPLVVASIIIPVAFSGLLIRILTEVAHSLFGMLERLVFETVWQCLRWYRIFFRLIRVEGARARIGMTSTSNNAA